MKIQQIVTKSIHLRCQSPFRLQYANFFTQTHFKSEMNTHWNISYTQCRFYTQDMDRKGTESALHSSKSLEANTESMNETDPSRNGDAHNTTEKNNSKSILISGESDHENKTNSTGDHTNDTNMVPPTSLVSSDKLDKRAYTIAFTALLTGVAIGIVIPVMPVFATQIGINTGEYGRIVAVMGLTRLVFNIPAAWAAERFGRKPILIGGPAISAVGLGLTGTAGGLNELLFYRFLSGAGGSLQMTGAQLYLSDISNVNNRARTMAPLMAGFAAGSALGPAIGGLLLEQFGVRNLFLCVGGGTLLISAFNYFQLPETKAPVKSISPKLSLLAEFKNSMISWKSLFKNSNLNSILTVNFCYWFASSSCAFTLMPLFACNTLHLSSTTLGGYFTLMSIITVIGSQGAAWIVDKFGRKTVIVPGMLMLSLSAIGMMTSTNGTQLLLWLILWSFGSTAIGTAPVAYVTDVTTPTERAPALALFRSAGDLGLFLGAGLMGTLAHFSSPLVATSVCSSLVFVSALAFAFRAKEIIFTQQKK